MTSDFILRPMYIPVNGNKSFSTLYNAQFMYSGAKMTDELYDSALFKNSKYSRIFIQKH